MGTRTIATTKAEGDFLCPICLQTTGYVRREVRRYTTLLSVAVAPRGVVGEYVECVVCHTTFDTAVLDRDPVDQAHFESEFHKAIRRVMTQILLADGVIAEAEVRAMSTVHEEMAGTPLSEATIRAEIALVQGRDDLDAFLDRMVGRLNDLGRELVIRAAYKIAVSDGDMHPEEHAMILRVAHRLEVHPAHLRGILADLSGTA